jgi:hypothetical protein
MLAVAPAWAFDPATGEVLRYQVYWGPLKMGKAQLDYVPQGGAFGKASGYELTAHVWDESSLLDLDDSWRAVGRHSAKALFTPSRYEVRQAENSYRADKLLEFNPKTRRITYTNRIDPHDTIAPAVWQAGMKDVLSAIYGWRAAGVAEVRRASHARIMGVKRPLTLAKAAGVHETLRRGGKTVAVWRVDITGKPDGKKNSDVWTVRLSDDAALTPLQIDARTKFGNLRAVLDE